MANGDHHSNIGVTTAYNADGKTGLAAAISTAENC
jgi:hypothetical protein